MKNRVYGYKVFNPDWTCSPSDNTKQYACPGKFKEKGPLEIRIHGMHFCQTAADCFRYYNFNSNNKVAEVIAYGEVLTDGNVSCTDRLEIVREIPWDEVLRIVNLGKNCTGYGNTENYNAGNLNSGSGNNGDYNSGDRNNGYRNSGDRNNGNYNSGDGNNGDCNSGDRNNGDCNSGNRNIGIQNSGEWNKTNFSNGCFNTAEPKIYLFNKLSEWTYRDWLDSKARYLLNRIVADGYIYIPFTDMTDKEKQIYPEAKINGGYYNLKVSSNEERQEWWDRLSAPDKETVKSIPNFDPEIFKDITGIDVRRGENNE